MSKEETTTKFTDLLPEAVKESLSELHIEALQEAFDAAVEKKVQDQIGVAVKAAEADFDAMFNERLEKLASKMEETSKKDFQRVYKALNERVKALRGAYEKRIATLTENAKSAIAKKQELVKEAKAETRKAQKNLITENTMAKKTLAESIASKENEAKDGVLNVANHYRNIIKEERKMSLGAMSKLKHYFTEGVKMDTIKFKKRLLNGLGNYIDSKIDAKIPYETVKEAVRNQSARRLVESLKTMLAVDSVSKMEAIKAPINEARQMITESKSQNAELLTENQKLHNMIAEKNEMIEKQMNESKQQMAKAKAALKEAKRVAYLNEKLSTLPSTEQRQFVKNVMADQSIEFIKENWDYAVKQYRAKVNKENNVLAERAKAERKSKQMADISRRRLTEASRSVREAKEKQLNESSERSQIDNLIDQITSDNGWM